MLKFNSLILPLSITLGSATALAQDTASGTTHSAIEAAEDAARAAAEAVEAVARRSKAGNTIKRQPRPQIKDYGALSMRPTDYPPESWKNDETGIVEYELSVDETGRVIGCTVIESSGFERLDIQTCRVATSRAEFEPATDDAGVPIVSVHKDRMIWRKREPDFGENVVIHVAYTVTAEGEIVDCEVIEISGEMTESMKRQFEREPCPGAGRRNSPPYRDADGNPISKRIELKLSVSSNDL